MLVGGRVLVPCLSKQQVPGRGLALQRHALPAAAILRPRLGDAAAVVHCLGPSPGPTNLVSLFSVAPSHPVP